MRLGFCVALSAIVPSLAARCTDRDLGIQNVFAATIVIIALGYTVRERTTLSFGSDRTPSRKGLSIEWLKQRIT